MNNSHRISDTVEGVVLSRDFTPHIVIQGMTGKEGQRALKFMQAGGSDVVAGVTPGKGGQSVEGVPIYDSVAAARTAHPEINVSCVYVPPRFAPDAVDEALENDLRFIHVFSEGIPTLETAQLLERARRTDARILGPSAVGMLRPDHYKIGGVGGTDHSTFLPATEDDPGIAIFSKSGGMVNTVADMFTQAEISQSYMTGIGGDRFVGSTFADLLQDVEDDPLTRAIILIGEIGGSYEEDFARALQEREIDIPIYAFISGRFAETLPTGVAFGHAGAIVSEKQGSRAHKIAALEEAGAVVVEDIGEAIKQLKD